MYNEFKSGFITIVGKPNVGKSTLMNALIGEKISIVSNKPQTTRNKIMGVLTKRDFQIVFLDTPGIHKPKNKLGEFMKKSVNEAMKGMDELIVIIDAKNFRDKDIEIIESMNICNCFKVILINKIDLLPKEEILKIIDRLKEFSYNLIIPISAKTGDGLRELEQELVKRLPNGPMYFPDGMITDQPERILCGEIIREKALLNLSDEIPHGIGIEMVKIETIREDLIQIDANIYCEKESHKRIVIGKNGSMLGKIGKEARLDIENLMGNHVNLKLWVKVREDWRNKHSDLNNLGYSDKI